MTISRAPGFMPVAEAFDTYKELVLGAESGSVTVHCQLLPLPLMYPADADVFGRPLLSGETRSDIVFGTETTETNYLGFLEQASSVGVTVRRLLVGQDYSRQTQTADGLRRSRTADWGKQWDEVRNGLLAYQNPAQHNEDVRFVRLGKAVTGLQAAEIRLGGRVGGEIRAMKDDYIYAIKETSLPLYSGWTLHNPAGQQMAILALRYGEGGIADVGAVYQAPFEADGGKQRRTNRDIDALSNSEVMAAWFGAWAGIATSSLAKRVQFLEGGRARLMPVQPPSRG